jgi:hypothetical protein
MLSSAVKKTAVKEEQHGACFAARIPWHASIGLDRIWPVRSSGNVSARSVRSRGVAAR